MEIHNISVFLVLICFKLERNQLQTDQVCIANLIQKMKLCHLCEKQMLVDSAVSNSGTLVDSSVTVYGVYTHRGN